jgi:Rap1a immunity proteins
VIQASGVTTLRGEARALNARSVPSARGAPWSAEGVSNIIKRSKEGHAMTGTRRDATAALVFGLLAAALLAENADAQTKPDRWSANYLMPACRDWIAGDRQGRDYVDEAMCAGIISGLAYTAKFLPPDTSSCRPQGVTIGQMVGVVVGYIERRPERMHEDFRRLAIEAWHEAWPCM